MSIDELATVGSKVEEFEAARARRAECADAMKDLEHAAARPLPGREEAWRSGVEAALIALRDAFGEHILISETKGGLFEELTRDSPRLIPTTRVLADEHVALKAEIEDATAAIAAPGPIDVYGSRERVLHLLMHLSRHRQAASDLVYEAFELDLGGVGD